MMNMSVKKAIIASLILCISVISFSGCGAFSDLNISKLNADAEESAGDKSSIPQDESLIVVGISQLGSESAWRVANTQSIQETFSQENGYFMIFDNARQKQENQIKAIRSFISQRVDYIILAPVIEDGWDTVLTEAKDAGIPVIIMDRTISVKDDSLYTTHVGSNQKEEGLKAGKWLESELFRTGRSNDQIDIVILQGTKGSSAQRGRTIGFDTIYEKHKNWNILTVRDGDFTVSKGREEMQDILKDSPDFDVLLCQNDDMAIGAMEVLKEHGITTGINGDVMVISIDATKDGLLCVQNGTINVDIECNPIQGEAISDIIKKLEVGESVEKEYFVDENIFTIDNVDSYIDSRIY